jgi:ribonuclease HI
MDVKIIAYFDGSLREEVGIGAWYLEILADNEIIETDNGYITKIRSKRDTSNKMEFKAFKELLKAIKIYKEYPCLREISIKGDNKGVIDCLNFSKNGYEYHVAKDIGVLDIPMKVEWISRKFNKKADKICREVYKSLTV